MSLPGDQSVRSWDNCQAEPMVTDRSQVVATSDHMPCQSKQVEGTGMRLAMDMVASSLRTQMLQEARLMSQEFVSNA